MDPITPSSVLLLPGILAFFGAFVYGVAFGNGAREHSLPRYRWVGVGLLALALIFGFLTVWKLFEPGLGAFYRAQLTGKKVLAAHYASLVLPLMLLLGAFGLEAWFKRFQSDMR